MGNDSSSLYLASGGIVPALGVSLEDLETYVSHARQGQYLLMAGITLLIYDYFCTIDEEVSFVWSKPPYLVAAKILFALNRYLPIFTLIFRFAALNKALYNAQDCNFALLSATGLSGVINVAIVEVVLLLRVWVLYSRGKWIGIALWSFYVVCLGVAVAIKYLQPHTSIPFVSPPTYGNTGCSRVVPAEMFFMYGVVTIVESVFFTMLLFKAYQTTRSSSDTPIITALLKQGTFYYFIVLAILTIAMFAPFSNELYWPIGNAVPIVPIVSIACNRLILSLRGMVFSQSAGRVSGFAVSESGSRDPSSHSGSGSGSYYPRPPSTKYVHSARNIGIHPVGGARKSAALNADTPATVVTFGNDWRGQNHQPDDSPVALDIHPVYDQRRQRGGGRNMEEAWSVMEGGNKDTSAHPMVSFRKG